MIKKSDKNAPNTLLEAISKAPLVSFSKSKGNIKVIELKYTVWMCPVLFWLRTVSTKHPPNLINQFPLACFQIFVYLIIYLMCAFPYANNIIISSVVNYLS